MKRDLNLMVKRPADAKAAKGILLLLLFLAVLGGLYYLATAIPAMIKASALVQKAALEKQLGVLSQVKEKFDTGTQTKKQLLDAIALVKELEGNKKDLAAMLAFVENACPKEITLHTVNFGSELLELGGYADDDLELSAFLVELRKEPGFKTVMVVQSFYNKELKKQDFTITAIFAQPLKSEPIVTEEKKSGQPAAQDAAGSARDSQAPQGAADQSAQPGSTQPSSAK